jgi:mono/diheme cytochrome c family protein
VRGCLACHHHDATAKEGDDLPAIAGEAQFGPNLSQIKAKLGKGKGDNDAARWLIQWVLDPHLHSPRSRMPVTHLTREEAADVAAWLLSQEPSDLGAGWPLKVAEPSMKTLTALARVYLIRNLSPYQIGRFFKGELATVKNGKVTENERAEIVGVLQSLPVEERELGRKIAESKEKKASRHDLMMYLGKKAVGRMGCFGCHDIPGFDHAKTIGVGLQDWGKKDPARLAFEDSGHFLTDNFYPVDHLADARGKPYGPKKVQGGRRKLPYERFFYDALMHRTREGFLNLKVRDPRSYDYNGDRAWDDLARMPQFKFARTRRKQGEDDKAYEARQLKEEDEAREAVMTFVLGLLAEPIPTPYVNRPAGDRLAEVRGRQVLDTFNCAGCHLIRPGVFEFRLTKNSRYDLAYNEESLSEADKSDFADSPGFPNHRNWAGVTPAPGQDVLRAHGLPVGLDVHPERKQKRRKILAVVLTEALRYRDKGGELKDLRASSRIILPAEDFVYPPADVLKSEERLAAFEQAQGPYGGTFADLLSGFLPQLDQAKYVDPNNSNTRASVPPVLLGEGERTRPDWLFPFLLDPQPVRRMLVGGLRMPRFNLSDEQARDLVAYFAGVERLTNPGVELTYPEVYVAQQQGMDQSYWRDKTAAYVKRLRESGQFDARLAELKADWEHILKENQDRAREVARSAEAARKAAAAADEALKKAKKGADTAALDRAKQKADQANDFWSAELARVQELVQDSAVDKQRKRWEEQDAYLTGAFRLLTDRNLCAKCHEIGSLRPPPKEAQGPSLLTVGRRLRPGWVKYWVAYPQRFLPHPSPMPQYFRSDEPKQYADLFPGDPMDRILAVRDVLMVLPEAQELPLNRRWMLPEVGAAPRQPPAKTGTKKKGESK